MPNSPSPPTPDHALEPAATLVGTTISDRYKVDSLLGAGGMGAVYLVHHTLMHKRFALKVLNSKTAQVPEMVARFEREALAAAHLEHPHIVVATDFGKTADGSFFLVLEYLEGQRLRDALKAGPLDIRRAMHIARQIASALELSHQHGVIHRDLKPENIMLVTRQGDHDFVKILDFGLAKVQLLEPGTDAPAQALTRAGTVCGTPKYMAPEQILGGAVDGRVDLYALGLILYEMLTGVHPFDDDDFQIVLRNQLAKQLPAIKSVAPAVAVPAALEAVVKRLTEKAPDKRYASATELLTALAEVADREGILPPEPSAGMATPLPRPATEPKGAASGAKTMASIDVIEEVGSALPHTAQRDPAVAKASTPFAKTVHSIDILSEVVLPVTEGAERQPPPSPARASVDQADTFELAKVKEQAETRPAMAAVTIGTFNPADLPRGPEAASPEAPLGPSFLRPFTERLPPELQKVNPVLLLAGLVVVAGVLLLLLLH